MPARRLSDEQERALYEEWQGGLSIRGVARKWGVDFHAAKRAIVRCKAEDASAKRGGFSDRELDAGQSQAATVEAVEAKHLGPEVLAALKRRPATLADLAEANGQTQGAVLDWLHDQRRRGANLHEIGGKWSLETTQPPPVGPVLDYRSRDDNTFVFGAMGDTHMGSKYERLDVLNRLYDRYEEEGVDRVFHTGNWIDGEARFNKFDLHVHGMGGQVAYLAAQYPKRPGIVTYAVAGDDHEGWYCQREGVDIGRLAEHAFRDAGRTDWVNLGYMESTLRLVNASSGKFGTISVVHPGGGSAYALSYSIQKIVESYEGGEKPSVGLYGHYHKLWSGNIRNVFVVQTGTCQDQTPFMRKKRLEAHVGGTLVKLRQDPATGAITECTVTILRYFNRSYYNDRWSHSGTVQLPARD